MIDFLVSEGCKQAYPTAIAGILVMKNVTNPSGNSTLDQQKETLENRLRSQFGTMSRAELEQVPPFPAYDSYYRRFKKTYHVFLQLESIAAKGKTIPHVAALVEAMFMAELENRMLTAGHDLDSLRLPVELKVANGSESYTLLRGTQQELKAGDMFMEDGEGIISSVLYGPDSRTQIQAGTKAVLFAVYAPPGIEEDVIIQHLQTIETYVRLISRKAETLLLQAYKAGA
jgi:DNA/RNA-binding domain of Phe-tRNA-synthetase-like protein